MTSRLDTDPATRLQVGAVIGAFTQLGLRDREERLGLSADLLGLDCLGSTRELTKGQAGKLLSIVRAAPDLASLRRTAAAARRRAGRRDYPGGLLGLAARVLDALAAGPGRA